MVEGRNMYYVVFDFSLGFGKPMKYKGSYHIEERDARLLLAKKPTKRIMMLVD